MLKIVFLFLTLLLTTSLFSQNVTNDELLTILDIRAFRVPSFSKKQWTIELIHDTLQKRKPVSIDKKLFSKTNALIAVKFDNDTTISFTLIQGEGTSSQGNLDLKKNRYEITWNKRPEYLFENTYVLGTISYEQDFETYEKSTELLIIQLMNELKFPPDDTPTERNKNGHKKPIKKKANKLPNKT